VVSSHYFESLRDVGMFLGMVNVVESSFEIPWLQKESSISLQLSLKFFVCLFMWSVEDKPYY